jgi:hypothetical protein
MKTRVLILSLLMLGLAVALQARHHSFSAYFDLGSPISVTGTIVKLDWVAPAVFVHLKAEDKATGKSSTWAFEAESFKLLESAFKLSKDMLKEGTVVTIVGYKLKPGANLSETVADPELRARVKAETGAAIAQFEFADGRKIAILNTVPEIPKP